MKKIIVISAVAVAALLGTSACAGSGMGANSSAAGSQNPVVGTDAVTNQAKSEGGTGMMGSGNQSSGGSAPSN